MITEKLFEHRLVHARPFDFAGTRFSPPTTARRPSILVKVRRLFRRCYDGEDGLRREFYAEVNEEAETLLRPRASLGRAILSPLSPFLGRFGVPKADRARMARDAARMWRKDCAGAGTGAVLMLLVDLVTMELYERDEVQLPVATEGGLCLDDGEDGDGWFPGVETVTVGEECGGGDCPICLQEIPAESLAARMPCSHVYHGGCIVEWLEKTQSCPMCRYSLLEPAPPSP